MTHSLDQTASWVIINRKTREVIMETFNAKLIGLLKPEFEAVPILKYLQSLNSK